MTANVTSIAKARELQLERKYSEMGKKDLGVLIERLEAIFDSNVLDQQGNLVKDLLFIYVRHIQHYHPLLADVIQMSFDDNSFKMLLPQQYIGPSEKFESDNAWYFGLTVESSDNRIPDITISPKSVESSINAELNGNNCNIPLMVEPVGVLISRLLSQGYHITMNSLDDISEGRALAMENGKSLVTMWLNLAVLQNVAFITHEN